MTTKKRSLEVDCTLIDINEHFVDTRSEALFHCCCVINPKGTPRNPPHAGLTHKRYHAEYSDEARRKMAIAARMAIALPCPTLHFGCSEIKLRHAGERTDGRAR
jgi:hypothetical protein